MPLLRGQEERRKILIGIAGVSLFVRWQPVPYHVERKLEVAAPPDLVFGVLNDLHQFAGVFVLFGSPFETGDPNMQKTFAGPAAGVGQSFAWTGKEAGQGKMTIEESVPGQKVGVKLEFVKPIASTASVALTLAGTPTGSVVTWSMEATTISSVSRRHVHEHGQHARRRHRERPVEDRRRGQEEVAGCVNSPSA